MDTGIIVARRLLDFDSLLRGKDEQSIAAREADILTLESISRRRWDLSLPSVIGCAHHPSIDYEGDCIFERPISEITDEEIFRVMCVFFPYLKYIDLSGILIAGGAIERTLSSLVEKRKLEGSFDMDLFLCGFSTVPELEERVKKLASDISLFMEKEYMGKVLIVRTENAITITHPCKLMPDLQIILRRYDTPSQVLHGFDIGSCAMGFWNGKFITTSLGKFSLEYKMNIFDISRCSYTYEYRLFRKYLSRGYGVILPDLDAEKVGSVLCVCCGAVARLNRYFTISGDMNSLLFGESVKHDLTREQRDNVFTCLHTGYCNSDYSFIGKIDIYRIISYNLKRMITSLYDKDVPARFRYGKLCSFETIVDNILSVHFSHVSKEDINILLEYNPIFDGTKLDIRRAKRYYSLDTIKEYSNYLIDLEGAHKPSIVEKLMREKQVEVLFSKIQELYPEGLTIPVKWRLDNPEEQLTGSFHTRITTVEEWYGEYYKE